MAEDLSIPPSVKYVVVHSDINNLDLDEPKIIVDGIIKIDKVFQEKLAADIKITLTCLSHQELNKVSNYLKRSCKDETKMYYLQQDRNWVHKNQSLNVPLYFKNYLHLIEPEINK